MDSSHRFGGMAYRCLSSHVIIRLREHGKQEVIIGTTPISALHFHHSGATDTVGDGVQVQGKHGIYLTRRD